MTKISTLSDQPFSFSQWNRIFGVKNHNFFEPGQNIGIFASATKGMDTFLFEMSMKLMFTFKNFRNVYWHGTQHSALATSKVHPGKHCFTDYDLTIIYLACYSPLACNKSPDSVQKKQTIVFCKIQNIHSKRHSFL